MWTKLGRQALPFLGLWLGSTCGLAVAAPPSSSVTATATAKTPTKTTTGGSLTSHEEASPEQPETKSAEAAKPAAQPDAQAAPKQPDIPPEVIAAAIAEREAKIKGARKEAVTILEEMVRQLPHHRSKEEHGVLADALYKLAELHTEEAKEIYLSKMEAHQNLVEACQKDRSVCSRVPQKMPTLDLSKPKVIYEKLIADHPNFDRMGTVLYLYAFALRDEGKQTEAVKVFERLIAEHPKSKYVADAWMAVAEQRFYVQSDYKGALSAYEQVLTHPKSQLYDLALFKTAWCYWKLGETTRAAQRFKDVLDLSKKRQAASVQERKRAEELSEQALEYLVELFTEDDSKSAADAYRFLAQIGGKEYSALVLRRLADTVYDQTRYARAAEAYALLLELDPGAADAPDIQQRIMDSYQRMGDVKRATLEMRKLATDYGPNSAWAKANRDRPKTVARAITTAQRIIANFAKSTHAEARRNEKESKVIDKERYLRAAEAYAFYLEQFPDSPEAAEIRYLRADILYFKLGRLEDAGREYLAIGKMQPVGKLHKDALLQAMTVLEKLRQPIAANAAGKKRAVQPSDRLFAEAADLYATLFPKDREIVTVIYKNGQFFYDYGDYDEAVKRFGLIVERYPDDPNARPAGDQLLGALNRAKDYQNIETWARRLKKTRTFSSPADQNRLDGLIVAAMFKQGELQASQGNLEKAAAAYGRIGTEYPNHPEAAKALSNAGAMLEKAKRPEDAVAYYEGMAKRYPNAKEVPEGLLVAARITESIADYEKAAELNERLAEKYPYDPRAADALHNAGVLRQTLGQPKRAIAHYTEFGKRYAKRPEAKDVAFQKGVVLETQGDQRGAAAAFAAYAATYPKDERSLEATVRQAQAEIQSGKDAAAKKTLDKVLRGKQKKARDGKANYFLAQARYLEGEVIYARYEQVKIAGGPKTLRKVLAQKAQLLEDARKVYLDVVSYRVPEWATAALARIGGAYEAFAQALRKAPVPKDLNADEQQVYRDELEQYVVVIEDKALDAYKSGYAKAIELGVYNKHTRTLREALVRLDEQNYPQEREERLGPQLGEAVTRLEWSEEVRRDQ